MSDNVSEDLDLNNDRGFDKRSAGIRNVFHLIMLGLILCALSGILGYGFWTKERSGTPGVIEVEYEKLLRKTKVTEMTVLVYTQKNDTICLRIGSEYFDKINFKTVRPQPCKISFDEAYQKFYFLSENPGLKKIIFNTVAEKYGSLDAEFSFKETTYKIEQFIFP